MHPNKVISKKSKILKICHFLADKFSFCGITFFRCTFVSKFIFLESAKNKNFFSTNHDLFHEKKILTLLRGLFDFLQSKNAFALGITQNIKNRLF